MREVIQKAFALVIFLLGVFFLISSGAGITGAVIGLPNSMPIIAIVAAITIISAILLFVHSTSTSLEQKIKNDPNINSFRRWLEKKERRKIDYGKAESLYNQVKSEYDKAVKKGLILSGYEGQPLKWAENYLSSRKSFEKWHHTKYDKTRNKKSDDNLESVFDELSSEYFKGLKSGKVTPGTTIDNFARSFVETQYRHTVTEIKHAKKSVTYRNYADECLQNGRIPTKPRELEHIALMCKYTLVQGRREGTAVMYKGEQITVIPNHDVSRHTYRGILKVLANGESTFRRYARQPVA